MVNGLYKQTYNWGDIVGLHSCTSMYTYGYPYMYMFISHLPHSNGRSSKASLGFRQLDPAGNGVQLPGEQLPR